MPPTGAPPYGYGPPPAPSQTNGLAIGALILGVLAVISSWTVAGGVLLGIAAIVLGFIGRRRDRAAGRGAGLSIAGIVTGIAGVVLGGLFLALYIAIGDAANDPFDDDGDAADPSTYELTDDTCEIDDDGSITAAGTIENTSNRSRTFVVRARFTAGGDEIDSGTDRLFISQGDRDDYEISGDVGDAQGVSCEVSVER
jgi:hypothetical protein